MRFGTFAFVIMLLLSSAVGAQESEFPTLDALANLEIPPFDYVDTARRLSRIDIDHTHSIQAAFLPNRRPRTVKCAHRR